MKSELANSPTFLVTAALISPTVPLTTFTAATLLSIQCSTFSTKPFGVTFSGTEPLRSLNACCAWALYLASSSAVNPIYVPSGVLTLYSGFIPLPLDSPALPLPAELI